MDKYIDFNFNEFYEWLLNSNNPFDSHWDQFPSGRKLLFKKETLPLLKESVEQRDKNALSKIIAILFYDGADEDYTDILLDLLGQQWHSNDEDIVEVLELIRDTKSINKLYQTAINVPAYDEMRALAIKCIDALGAIQTSQSKEKLSLLANFDDEIIKENAIRQIKESFPN